MADVDAVAATDSKDMGKNNKFKIPPKKPQLSKAERRALQEKQRAEKAARMASGGSGKKGAPKKPQAAAAAKESSNNSNNKTVPKKQQDSRNDRETDKTSRLFSHLPKFRDRSKDPHLSGVFLRSEDKSLKVELHPAVLALGIKYADGTVRGANARCRAMMECFRTVLSDYEPPDDESRRNLPAAIDQQVLKPSFQHWTANCRHHSVTMGNAFSFLKTACATDLSRDDDVATVRESLSDRIEAYVQERVDFAARVVSKHVNTKIADGDVLLVYGRSEVVVRSLIDAAVHAGKRFRVVVADARPLHEGRVALRELAAAGVDCTYASLNALSYALESRGVTKALLGAAALTSDGSVLSRVGTAGVALAARARNVPVLVCCETYKIHDRSRLESDLAVGHESGDPRELSSSSSFGGSGCADGEEKKEDVVDALHVLYDTTPSHFVDGIVTEVGILPPTSVAVLLREMTNINPRTTTTTTSGR